MNAFVEECRSEWRRLRVPDPIANEMAADLASDLAEAEADGVSAEEVLGSSAFDARSFAASWAAERGVIPSSPARAHRLRKPVSVAVVAIVSALGAVVAVVVLFASRSGSSVAVAPVPQPLAARIPPGQLVHRVTAVDVLDALAGLVLVLAILGIVLSAYFWMSRRRPRPPAALA